MRHHRSNLVTELEPSSRFKTPLREHPRRLPLEVPALSSLRLRAPLLALLVTALGCSAADAGDSAASAETNLDKATFVPRLVVGADGSTALLSWSSDSPAPDVARWDASGQLLWQRAHVAHEMRYDDAEVGSALAMRDGHLVAATAHSTGQVTFGELTQVGLVPETGSAVGSAGTWVSPPKVAWQPSFGAPQVASRSDGAIHVLLGVDAKANLWGPGETDDSVVHPDRSGLQLVTCLPTGCTREQVAVLPSAEYASYTIVATTTTPVIAVTTSLQPNAVRVFKKSATSAWAATNVAVAGAGVTAVPRLASGAGRTILAVEQTVSLAGAGRAARWGRPLFRSSRSIATSQGAFDGSRSCATPGGDILGHAGSGIPPINARDRRLGAENG